MKVRIRWIDFYFVQLLVVTLQCILMAVLSLIFISYKGELLKNYCTETFFSIRFQSESLLITGPLSLYFVWSHNAG